MPVHAPGKATGDVAAHRPGRRLRWWRELAGIVAFYGAYSAVRNTVGSARAGSARHAFDDALHVIRVEQALHVFIEPALQHAVVSWQWFIVAWNVFYASAHFVVTAAVFIWLFRTAPARFVRCRNALGWTTALALVGFALFPLMPPRLVDAPGPYGGQAFSGPAPVVRMVDTVDRVGGLWRFGTSGSSSTLVGSVSNQFASMPSLHVAWALWVTCAVWPLVRRRVARVTALMYPVATVFCVVVTANHYLADAVAGAAVVAVAGRIAGWTTRRGRRSVPVS